MRYPSSLPHLSPSFVGEREAPALPPMGDFTAGDAFLTSPAFTGNPTTPTHPTAARRPESTSMRRSNYGTILGPLVPEKIGVEVPVYRSDVTVGLSVDEEERWRPRKDSGGHSTCGSECGSTESSAPALRQLLGVRRSSVLLVVYALFYVSYLATGGLVFSAMEAPIEMATQQRVLAARTAFLLENACVSDDALEELIREVMEASKRGVSAARNVTGEPNWSFGQSLFFSSTVVTTIGYGHVTPLSKGGKIFCMVYATLGIPLTLVLLTALVERLASGPSSALLRALNSRLGHLYPPFTLRLLHLTLLLLLLAPLLFFIPAAIFSRIEPTWDYLDALYYCFISLTTIGLGDYVPGDNPDQPYRPLYKVATTMYLLVGLTLMMLALTVFYDIPQLNFGLFFLPRSDETQSGHSGVPGGLLSSVSSGMGDSEKSRLRTPGALPGPKYTQQLDHCGSGVGLGGGAKRRQHQVVRVKSRARDDDDDDDEEESGAKRQDGDDSPSPGEDTTPVHAQRP